MKDLISRQAVLKLLHTLPPEEAMTKAMLIQNVKYMSAAQPEKRTEERTEKHACDLISRQALCEYALNQKDKSITANDIMRFPSAQPEPQWIPFKTRPLTEEEKEEEHLEWDVRSHKGRKED